MGRVLEFHKYFPELGDEIWYFPRLKRTFPILKKLIEVFPQRANGRIIWAGVLTQAKGRFARKWFASEGGLWIGISVYDEFFPETKGLIPLIFGLAIVKTLVEFGVERARVKWINDVHLNGRKLAGVLIEKFNEWFLIGIGINVNNSLPYGIPATSIKEVIGKEQPLPRVFDRLIKWIREYLGFLRYYERCLQEEKEVENIVINDFLRYSDTIGRCVYYAYDTEKDDGIIGIAEALTPLGSLVLKTKEDRIEVNSGEIIYLW
ncbi:MAG: biotin--[acetyl-CoA-carboxylase] ligase [Thermodesulfobacteria bacterium]|nr:biotin--[acetyl-CoA-carboxylase] ligase [Thermodesulfobacteriota bacterium]